MAEKNFKITGGLALGDYAITANGLSLLWNSNAIATQSYVDTALSGVTVNTNAIATSLVGTGLFVDSGDNLNVNTNVIATLTDTQTLSNKTLSSPTITAGSSATVDRSAWWTGSTSNYFETDTNANSVRFGTGSLTINSISSLTNIPNGTLITYTGTDNTVVTFIKNGTPSVSGQGNIFMAATSISGEAFLDQEYVLSYGSSVTISSTEISYLDGVTSNIQTQLNNITVNTNAIATSLSSATLWVSDGDNLNVNTNAIVENLDGEGLYVTGNQLAVNAAIVAGLLDGEGLYVSGNTLAVNTNAIVENLDGEGLYVTGNQLAVNAAIVAGLLDGEGLYVSGNTLAVNTNAIVNNLDGSGLYVDGITLAVNTNVIASKAYVDSVAQGLDVKEAVYVATTENLDFNTGFVPNVTIDGLVMQQFQRILIKNQTDASQNGIYIINESGAPTRASDANANDELNVGSFVFVANGTVNAGKGFVVTTMNSLGMGSVVWTQFSSTSSLTAGSGIYLSGSAITANTNSIAASLAGTTLWANADDLNVNVNAIAGSGLIGGSTLSIDQYAASITLSGLDAAGSTGGTLTEDVFAGNINTSNTYLFLTDKLVINEAFTYEVLLRITTFAGTITTRKSTVSGFFDESGTAEYTEYGIVDSATPMPGADVAISTDGTDYFLAVKATLDVGQTLKAVAASKKITIS